VNTPEQSDAALAIRCQLGEREAWDELVARWHPRLWRFISRMLSDREEAEDVLQSAWLRIVRSLASLQEPERLGAWLYSIVRRTVADRLREQYRRPPPEAIGEVGDWDDGVETLEVLDSIETGLRGLHPVDREAVVLHYLEELSVADVAEVCGVPPGTIKSRLHRARTAIRKTLNRGLTP
jgi:RNA polymerase sigma-70 factor (ECF subfamily)